VDFRWIRKRHKSFVPPFFLKVALPFSIPLVSDLERGLSVMKNCSIYDRETSLQIGLMCQRHRVWGWGVGHSLLYHSLVAVGFVFDYSARKSGVRKARIRDKNRRFGKENERRRWPSRGPPRRHRCKRSVHNNQTRMNVSRGRRM
jgi:hypothetical protein